MSRFNYRKATQALNFLALKSGGEIDTLKAMKLIWLADRLHLRKYGRLITNDDYFAMKLGPVASSTYNLIKKDAAHINPEFIKYSDQYIIPGDRNRKSFISGHPVEDKIFSKSDLHVLNDVFEKFGNMTKWQLSDYSHLFNEWTRFETDLANNPTERYKMDLADFFTETQFGDSVFDQDVESLDCVKEIFEEGKEK